jgi:hypothetical protein
MRVTSKERLNLVGHYYNLLPNVDRIIQETRKLPGIQSSELPSTAEALRSQRQRGASGFLCAASLSSAPLRFAVLRLRTCFGTRQRTA